MIKDWSVSNDGRYLFAAPAHPVRNNQNVLVFDLSDGHIVGSMRNTWTTTPGYIAVVDMFGGITSCADQSGNYIVAVENDLLGRIDTYVWSGGSGGGVR
jgi:hypothetical protein